jgi:hypothetical protein
MKLIIHCGFPKTGTTALQHWCARNECQLEAQGVFYPVLGRDKEGFAHHLVAANPSFSPLDVADQIAESCKDSSLGCIFISTESLSNRLNTEDQSGALFFMSLIEGLKQKSFDPHLFFTVRSLSEYLCSIISQNIIYDGLSIRPMDCAAYFTHSLYRSYSNLFSLLEHNQRTIIFNHSDNINHEILESVFQISGSACPANIDVKIFGESSRKDTLLAFIWMNHLRILAPDDLVSYLRYDRGALEILSNYCKENNLIKHPECAYFRWCPNSEVLHSMLNFVRLGYTMLSKRNAGLNQSKSITTLCERISCDCMNMISKTLIDIDLMYLHTKNSQHHAELGRLFEHLLEDGRQSFGINFKEMLRPRHITPK